VRSGGQWEEVAERRMGCAVVRRAGRLHCVKQRKVLGGEPVLLRGAGVRVRPLERSRQASTFGFMSNEISMEVNKPVAIRGVRGARDTRARGERIVVVPGPAVIHSGGDAALVRLIRAGWIDGVLSGNAFAVHDLEKALLSTSLGVCQRSGRAVEGGSRNRICLAGLRARCVRGQGHRRSAERGVPARACRDSRSGPHVRRSVAPAAAQGGSPSGIAPRRALRQPVHGNRGNGATTAQPGSRPRAWARRAARRDRSPRLPCGRFLRIRLRSALREGRRLALAGTASLLERRFQLLNPLLQCVHTPLQTLATGTTRNAPANPRGAGTEESSAWLADDMRTLGARAELAALGQHRPVSGQIEDELRARLGLAPRPANEAGEVLCVLEREPPRARAWAEIHARRLAREGTPARVVTAAELTGAEDPARVRRLALGSEWPLAGFAEGRGLPLAPGDFGGTTVLVVPAQTLQVEREGWIDLERTKALAKRSPFAGLRVALDGGEPSLATVLGELTAKGARSVLVVPTVFCAAPEEMQALRKALGPALASGGELDLTWLPGLGAELVGAALDD
jgi:hypothetical protein